MMSQTVSPADGSSLLGVTQESFVSENGGVIAVNLGSAASSLASRAGFLIFDDQKPVRRSIIPSSVAFLRREEATNVR